MQDNTIVAVDFGSSTIRLCVGELTNGQLRIIGVFEESINGVKNGLIVDFDEAIKGVKSIFNEVFTTLYFYPKTVHLGLDLSVFKREKELSDIIKNISQLSIKELLSSLVVKKEYSTFQRYVDLFGTAGVRIVNFYPLPLVSFSVLTEYDERMDGVIIIDIGENATSGVSVIGNKINIMESVPYGGADITDDISFIFKKNKKYSKSLKEEYGCCCYSNLNNEPIVLTVDKINISFEKKEFSRIVEARINEIFTLFKNAISYSPRLGNYSLGIILIGGGAMLQGVTEMASEIFILPVHIGFPEAMYGLSREYINPMFANVLGIIKIASGTFFDGKPKTNKKKSFFGIYNNGGNL